jgi:hypothetical protein
LKKKIPIAFLWSLICYAVNAQILLPENKISLPIIISETSGIEIINDSIFVTHNDSGNDPVLFFINKKGELKSNFKLKKTINSDWEDIAFDGKEFIYIADLGNNLNNRTNLMIHRFSIKDSSETTMKIKYLDQKFPMRETNRNFDSEAMILLNENLYTFTKANSTPYTGLCKMYKINLTDSIQELNPMDSMVLGDEGYWKNSVTSADISDDKTKLALLTYKYLYFFYDFIGDDFFGGKYMRFLLPEIQQREAVVFDSIENIWITDENSRLQNGGFLYFYDMQKINKGDFFYRESEVGIVSVKTKKTNEEGIRQLNFQAQVTKNKDFSVEILKNGKIIHTTIKKSNGKIKDELKFLPDDTYTEIYSIRIYDEKKLVYANKFDPFK